jgi:hypothetical protein
MTFDDGFNPEMTSREDFRAKLAAVLNERGIGFTALCEMAGVLPSTAQRAVELGTYGLPSTSNTLIQLLGPLGLKLDWLIDAPVSAPKLDEDKRQRLREIVWQFILRKDDFPWKHRRPLLDYELAKLGVRPQNTVLRAARSPIPRNVTDVAYDYERLKNEGYFNEV